MKSVFRPNLTLDEIYKNRLYVLPKKSPESGRQQDAV